MEKKKSPVIRIIVGVVAVILVLGMFGACSSGSKTNSTTDNGTTQATQTQSTESTGADVEATPEAAPAPEPAPEPEPVKEDYTITDETLDNSNSFALYIRGVLTNNTDRNVSYIQLEYVLYDANGVQVGTAYANTSNLKAGGSWKFDAIGTASPDEVASYELVDITAF